MAPAGDQREAGEARDGDGLLDVLGRAVLRQGGQRIQGHHDAARGLLGELQGTGEQTRVILQDALGRGALDDRGDLGGVEGGRDLLPGLQAHEVQHPVGEAVEHGDDGAEDARDPHQGRGEQPHRLLGGGDRHVLGHHLTRDDMDVDDQDQGDDDGHGVRPAPTDPETDQQRRQRVRDGGLGDDAQARRAHGDAELGGGEHP